MSLAYEQFDTGSGQDAWRTLLGSNCVDVAVATLKAYEQANLGRMSAEQRDEINFHMGQALAMSGRESESIPHFERASTSSSPAEWKAYVAANLAFVRKDRPALEQALTDYGKMSSPTSTRLGFIRGFLKCIDKPYMEAAHCGM
jgi:hypothetical protein